MTVVIPTLTADSTLTECLQSLERQTYRSFDVTVVDNSGESLAVRRTSNFPRIKVIENTTNVGFGAAINQAAAVSRSPFIATLNDDAVASEEWLSGLMTAASAEPNTSMFASQVRLFGSELLDSAGMLICADGSSKQRGHREPTHAYSNRCQVLLPSGSAALYSRQLFDELGGFDEDFFLYCEDTDLGLRARRAGWQCTYVPEAVVHHRYSHSAGRASALKAYYVERNRLFLVVKNFPASALVRAPFVSLARYAWHVYYILRGEGTTGEFRRGGSGLALVWFVLKAHLALLVSLPRLMKKRRALSSSQFRSLMLQHSISAKRVAAL